MSEARTIALLEEILSKANDTIRRMIDMDRRLRDIEDGNNRSSNRGK